YMAEIETRMEMHVVVEFIPDLRGEHGKVVEAAAYEVVQRVPCGMALEPAGDVAYAIPEAAGPFQLSPPNNRYFPNRVQADALAIYRVDAVVGISDANAEQRMLAPYLPLFAPVRLFKDINVQGVGLPGHGREYIVVFDDLAVNRVYLDAITRQRTLGLGKR